MDRLVEEDEEETRRADLEWEQEERNKNSKE